MRGSDFILDSVQMMYYKCHKVNFKWGGLHIDSQDWIKKKKNVQKYVQLISLKLIQTVKNK